MKPELELEIDSSGQLKESGPESGSGDPARRDSSISESTDHCYVPRVRPSEANGFAVYTRSKRLKSRSLSAIEYFAKLQGDAGVSVKAGEAESSNGGVVVSGGGGSKVNMSGGGGQLGTLGVSGGESEGEMMEIEVKEEPTARRFTRSVLKSKDEDFGLENGNLGNLRETVVLEADALSSEELTVLGSPDTRKMEMKMSKKILIKGRPTTVRELFETGLLEGYPVFYNGGKRGFPLRGTITDAGILCSCILCKGAQVVPPCQFEIHACKSYRRASQYICLENGKSLLDVVKECRKSSVKSLEETIQNFIGPMPVKESVICRNCEGSFLATSAAKVELLCDSCMVVLNSDVDAECLKSRDQRMHKLVFENGGLPDGTEVAYYSNGKKLRDGHKMGSGIICRCCSTLVSPSQFEAHAGWASRRKPYMYIYTSNGVSLHEFAISLSKGRKYSSKDNDDLCIICADGGKLVLCDGCPRAFHKECASLSSIPRGKWYCTYCQNMFQREKFVESNANAVAAGRVSGIDPVEHITNRCIRHVKNPEDAEVIACVLCRGYDFSKSGFGPRTVILCDQCEKEYHVGCLKKSKLADLKELPKGKWFCSADCKWIYSTLQNLLNAGAEELPDSTVDILKKKEIEKNSAYTNFDVRWRLLNGKNTSRETRVLLSQAVAIFHDCFDPIVDSETGRDFILSLVYGRNIRGQDFSGMYCAILTVNSTVVSAGILRIFGQEIAELPLAATRIGNQGKGYFQILHSCIEKLLAFLNIKSLVLPATDEAKSIWTEKFGFKKIPQEQLLNYRKICWQMMTFKGTSMLEKAVPKCRIINNDEEEEEEEEEGAFPN
ncbi:hypothetical protein MIMGU_mgv1a001359mg [Erythranthe guttata]|uniref:PHD-type domain-containing protein n=1 Tax=Erythranthe guttata TaxID=4155 RepID=A0A022RNM1_ERYGU|nr:hypothetical protein MIMGU_mgv1a001359mg [Erythranthe guttata]